MKIYKAALIGCGSRAKDHIEAYRLLPNAKVVACAAPSEKRRDPLAHRYGLKPYADAGEMILKERPDMIHIITWPETRVPLMTLVSDLHVPLCTVEKPIAAGIADWRELEKLESVSETKFAVCHQFRWHPDFSRCRNALLTGAMGEVKFLDISSGMNIAGQGTHTLNYGRSLIGDARVDTVFANALGWDASDPGHPAPIATEAYLFFENGVRALWTSGSVSPRAGDPETSWQHVRIAAYADRGRVNYEEFGKWEVISPAGDERGEYGGMERWSVNKVAAQAGFHQAMFDWLEDRTREPGTSLRESLHEWAVVLAVYQSAWEARPILIREFNPSDDLIERMRAR